MSEESYFIVRVLWVKGKDPKDALNKYFDAIGDCESEAIWNGILPDSETLIVMKWGKGAEGLYNLLKHLGQYLDERKKNRLVKS